MYSLVCAARAGQPDLLAAGLHHRPPRGEAGDEAVGRGRAGIRKAPAIGFAISLAAMLYTHNWALFFGVATGVAWLVLLALARGTERRRLALTGLLGYGLAALLYLPWLPNMLYQAAHTGAPWSRAPSLAALASTPAKLLGTEAEIAVLLAGGAGIVVLLARRHAGRLTPPGRAVLALLIIGRADDRGGLAVVPVLPRLGQPLPVGGAGAVAAADRRRACLCRTARARRPGADRRPVGDRRRPAGEEQRARSDRGHRPLAAAGGSRHLDPAGADPGPALLPPAGTALREPDRTGAGRRRDRLARRRRATGGDLARARPRAAARRAALGPAGRARAADLLLPRVAGARRGPSRCG